CDDYLPDSFRSKYNSGVLLYDETGALRGHLYASEELTGLGLFDHDGKPRAALIHRNGWSGCFLKDHGGALPVGLALDAADGRRAARTTGRSRAPLRGPAVRTRALPGHRPERLKGEDAGRGVFR